MKVIRFLAYLSAFLSLAISSTMVYLWCKNTEPPKVVSLDTFIGVSIALLGLIVTLAIAWQIYNAFEMRSKIEELIQLENRLKKQEKSLEQFKLETTRDLCGVAMIVKRESNDIPLAFSFLIDALNAEIQLEKPVQFDDILDTLVSLNDEVDESLKVKKEGLDEIIKQDKELRSRSNYRLIKRRYEPIFEAFMSKLKKEEKQS